MDEAEKAELKKEAEGVLKKANKDNDEHRGIDLQLEALQNAQLAVAPESGSASNEDDVTEECPPQLEEVDLEEEKRK